MSDDGSFQVYTGGFVVLPNETVNDKRLSFRARGLLAYLIGRPPGWRFATERIAKESGGPLAEGRDAVRSAMRELIALGYLRRSTRSAPNGQLTTLTEVAARPDLLPPDGSPPGEATPDDPTPGQPMTAHPSPVVPSPKSVLEVVNKEIINKDSQTLALAPAAPVAKPRPTGVPESFPIFEHMVAWARDKAPGVDPHTETEQWHDWHRAKGDTARDWNASWRTWMRRAQEHVNRGQGPGRPGAPKPSTTDQRVAAGVALMERLRSEGR